MKIFTLVITTMMVQLEMCVPIITLYDRRRRVPHNNVIGSLVADPILEQKHSVTILFSNRTDRIDACLQSIYEKTVFGVELVGRLDGKHDEILQTGSQWFLIISDDAEDDAWWTQAVAKIYTHGPYRPTVVLWFDAEPVALAVRYQILQITWHDFWLHKIIIAYPSQCNRTGTGNCIVLTAAKDSAQIDNQISMVSLLADENNLTAAIDAMKDAQLEFEEDFNGRTLKTAVFLKTSYIERIKLPGNQTELVGIDIEALNAICNQLNLTPEVEVVGRGSVYNDNLNATLLSLDNRKESFYLNRYFNSPLIKEYMLPISIETFYFIIQNRQTGNQFWKIFSGFQPSVWAMVGVTFVAVAVIWRCILAGSTLSLVQAALSTSHIELQRTLHRLVWISWLLFVLLIVNSLNGTIVTQLTKPVHSHAINTLNDLLESDIGLYTEVQGFTNERQDPVVTVLASKLIDVYMQRPSADDVRQAAFLTTSKTRSILRQLNRNGDHDFYVIPEVVDQLSTGYLMSPRNPAFDTFKRTVTTLLETGYYEKWTRDYVNNVTHNTERYTFYNLYNSTGGRDRTSAMSFKDLVLAFRLYLVGTLLAFLAFLGEIFIYEFQKRNIRKTKHARKTIS